MLGLSESGEVFTAISNKTFPEFVDYVLEEWRNKFWCNEHWQPQYMHCDYCEINYDIIGRVETLDEDLRYIAHKNNFTSALEKADKNILHFHRSGSKNFSLSGQDTSNLENDIRHKQNKTIHYFSTLNTNQLVGLYLLYQLDFEIFGYSQHPYVQTTLGGYPYVKAPEIPVPGQKH